MLRVAVTQFTRPTLRQTLRQAVRRQNGQEAAVSSEPGKGEAPSPRRPRSVERARRGAGRLTGARLLGQSLARSVGQTRGAHVGPGSSYVILKQMGHLAGGVLAGEQQSQIYFLLTLTSAASVAGGMDLESGQCLLGDWHILR